MIIHEYTVINILQSKFIGLVFARSKSAAMRKANKRFGYDVFNRAFLII